MTRQEFQLIAETRIEEATILFETKLYSGAYYLAGYALECGIKACLSKQIAEHKIPKKKFITDLYTNDLLKLIKLDDALSNSYDLESKNNIDFLMNWTLVKDWNESARYRTFDKEEAQELIKAITTTKGGMLPWVQQYW